MSLHRYAIAALAVFAPPAAAADLEADRRELLRLAAEARAAHLAYDPDALLRHQAEGFVSVSDGQVSTPTAEASRRAFSGYFESVRFEAWDDLAPPLITLSDDGTLATMLIQKRVRLVPKTRTDQAGSETDWAWLETWRKQDGRWRLQMIVSTNQPPRRIAPPAAPG